MSRDTIDGTEIPLPTWSEMFPQGRKIFYEGDDPDGFKKTMKDEFGIDLDADPDWAEWFAPVSDPLRPGAMTEGFVSYGFHCPAEHLDAIYGSDRFTLGS